MPGTGDHHKELAAQSNPFEDRDHQLSASTASKINILQSRLDKQLGPEYLSTRPGAGGAKVHYIAAEKVISLANDVFGFNGWSSQIQRIDIDFVDETRDGKISLGISIVMRVILSDGTFHEDIGYGQIENAKGKASAFEKAKKEAATDALKRALRTFGNVLGNCLYDKEYIKNVTKVKFTPTAWKEENLHRHPSYALSKRIDVPHEDSSRADGVRGRKSEKQADSRVEEKKPSESTDFEEDFGTELFDDIDIAEPRPDEVVVAPEEPLNDTEDKNAAKLGAESGTPQTADIHATLPVHLGFLTSRHAAILNSPKSNPKVLARLEPFNPSAESPSIRRTSGIDHDTSGPIKRQKVNQDLPTPLLSGPPASSKRATGVGQYGHAQNLSRDFVNPANEAGRRIGFPGSPGRTSSYKPPGVVGVQDGGSRPSTRRTPLTDVTNMNSNPAAETDLEKKRLNDTVTTRQTVSETSVG